MKKLKWIFLPAVLFGIIGSFIFFFASAQTQLPCDSVLIPTLEQFNKDYRLVQAYTFENAEFIYEHMRKFESGEIGGDILTDSFFGDYKSSSNKQEFFTRIQNKVTKEGYSLNVADSTSYTRRYLTKEQLDAWTNCIAKISEDGYVKLVVSGVSDDGFTLKVGWKPQRNTGPSNLNLQVVNGSINKKSNVSFKMTGFSDFSIYVNKKQGKNHTEIIANIAGNTDSVSVDYTLKPIKPPPKLVFKLEYTQLVPGGYTKRDDAQQMIVSAEPNGGPSENFSFLVDSPRAATYSLESLWTAAVRTEVYVYVKPYSKVCNDPNMNMDDADLHYFPAVTSGWSRGNLPKQPERLGYITLPAGKTPLIFTSRACGGGLGGGRLPSVAWILLTEQ